MPTRSACYSACSKDKDQRLRLTGVAELGQLSFTLARSTVCVTRIHWPGEGS